MSDAIAAARLALEAAGQLPDDEIDLAATALHFARIDRPDLDWPAAQARLSGLVAETVRDLPARDAALPEAIRVIREVLHRRHGFDGDRDAYDHPDNANFLAVLDRRRGLPVALGLLWLSLGDALGVPCHGLDVPGHFLIAVGVPGDRVVCDPFDRGRVVGVDRPGLPGSRPALAAPPMERRAVLLRLQNNIKVRRLQAGELSLGLDCVCDMLRLAPASALLRLEAAELQERLGRAEAALASLDALLALAKSGALTPAIAARAKASRLRLAARSQPLRDDDSRGS